MALGQQTTAAGTVPLAEVSTDGGTTWQQVAFISAGPDTVITALTAGVGGFTAAGQFGAAGQQGATVWISADGTNWTQSQLGGLTGGGNHTITTLARSGSLVTGIELGPDSGKPAVRHPVPSRTLIWPQSAKEAAPRTAEFRGSGRAELTADSSSVYKQAS